MTDGYSIWHYPKCSTSRFVLQALREAGVDPAVRDYLKEPPSEAELVAALAVLGVGPRAILRRKNTPYDELGLDDPSLTDAQLIALMSAHPLVIERPIVFGPHGSALCRPKEMVFDLLQAAEA
jgi:arsenate reductase